MQLDDMTDDEWATVERYLKTSVAGKVSPSVLRLNVNGMLWRMRTGSPWCAIPDEYGNWSSIRRRFQTWNENGVWRALTIILAEMRHGRTPDRFRQTRTTPNARAQPASAAPQQN